MTAGLLIAPPQSPGPVAATQQIGAANQRILNGFVVAKGMVFAGTWSGGNARVYRWSNPYDVTTADALLVADAFITNVTALGANLGTNKLFIGYNALNAGTGGNEITVSSTDLDAFGPDAEVVGQVALGNLDSSVASQQTGGVVSDGTNVYYLLSNTDQNSWVGKFLIADGSLVAQFQIPNPTTGNARGGSVLIYDGVGSLYAAGGTSNMWAAKIPVAVASATVLDLGGTGTTIAPQAFLDAAGFWVADYLTSATPRAFKVALNLLSSTTISLPRIPPGSPDAICDGSDGSTFWTLQGTTGSFATMTQFSKSTLFPLRVVEGSPVRNQFPAFMLPLDRAAWWLSQAGGQSTRPFATLTPFWTDLSNTPRTIAGRSAAW